MATPRLDVIAAVGNRGFKTHQVRENNKITCVDGFKLSVIAGAGTYCDPRPEFGGAEDYPGPYHAVEVGFPSERPEPWADWEEHAESPSEPCQTIYSRVPVKVVRALIESHGGEA